MLRANAHHNNFDFDNFFKEIRRESYARCSHECDVTQQNMWNEIDKILLDKTSDTVLNAVKIWMGGMIISMIRDDQAYRYGSSNDKSYPHRYFLQKHIDSYYELNEDQKNKMSYFKFIGDIAFKNPEIFNGELFEIKVSLCGGSGSDYLFPDLKYKKELINEMLAEARLLEKDENKVTRFQGVLFPVVEKVPASSNVEPGNALKQ